MPVALANVGLNAFYALDADGWRLGMETNLVLLDTLVQSGVSSVGITDFPGSPGQGQAHIVAPSGTSGDLVGKENWVVVFYTFDDASGGGPQPTWFATEPREGWEIYDRQLDVWWRFDGADWTINTLGVRPRLVRTITANAHTLELSDAGAVLELSDGSGVALTIPLNSDVPFAIGTEIVTYQAGAGPITFTPDDVAVTIISVGGADESDGQESQQVLRKVGTNTWRLSGDIA